jgi:hypothetical protein
MSVEINITDQIVEIEVAAGAIISPVWGGITGTLSNQTDLQNALNAKFDDPTGTTSQYLRGDGTLATFPSLTGFVPYTGATANVDLGTHTILAQNATIASSGSGDTATINHSSGSGIALNITKGGNNEGLYINKTGGSGNAATIIGTLNATTLVKSGGLSTEYLKADGSVSTLTNPITGTGTSGQVAYFTGATTQAGSNNLFWDSANGRLGIGTNAPTVPLDVVGSLRVSASSSSFVNSAGSNIVTIQSIPNGTNATLRLTSPANSWDISNGGASAILTFTRGTTQLGAWYNTGNLLLQNGGTFTDSGQRLQVTGDTLLKGSGNTSATTALTVQNSDGTTMLAVRNDNRVVAVNGIITGSTGSFSGLFPNGGSISFEGLLLRGGLLPSVAGTDILLDNAQGTPAITSGTRIFLSINRGFNPTSGTGVYNMFSIAPNAINQTGGANGITRGLYVNPTLTAAADWRSIEWSNNTGWGLYGAGTANNYLNGRLGIGTTTPLTPLDVSGAGRMGGVIITGNPAIPAGTAAALTEGYFAGGNYAFFQGYNYTSLAYIPVYVDGSFIALNPNSGGNVLIGSAISTGEKLQVNGTAKITGASSFGGNMSLTLNHNATTSLVITNTTSGTSAVSEIQLKTAGTSFGALGKYSSTTTPFKIINSSDTYLFNFTVGDIAILNNVPAGSIKFAAGGSSVAQWTIGSNGDLTANDGENIIVGTTTGTKIGTATSQKLSLWDATPIVQPTTGIAEAAFVENLGGSIVNVDSTFDGYTIQQVVKALRDMGALA